MSAFVAAHPGWAIFLIYAAMITAVVWAAYELFRSTDVETEDADGAWPWCEACQSWHHPANPFCEKE